jgi:hypothetical protein
MLTENERSLGVEGEAVRSRLATGEGFEPV